MECVGVCGVYTLPHKHLYSRVKVYWCSFPWINFIESADISYAVKGNPHTNL